MGWNVLADVAGKPMTVVAPSVLIGYSMRSGSTLLQHVLGQHSALQSFSDLSSNLVLTRLLCGGGPGRGLCVKPVDLVYLHRRPRLERRFDKRIWLARDPRDSYLSSVESGYAYLLWRRGSVRHGIDLGLLERWRRIHRRYFDDPRAWHLVRYEELVTRPRQVLARLLQYLGLPWEDLFPFPRFSRLHGGDYKAAEHTDVDASSVARHRDELAPEQIAVFEAAIGSEMAALGYRPDAAWQPARSA